MTYTVEKRKLPPFKRSVNPTLSVRGKVNDMPFVKRAGEPAKISKSTAKRTGAVSGGYVQVTYFR